MVSISRIPGSMEAIAAADAIRRRAPSFTESPICGIVLGSGLGGLVSSLSDSVAIPFADIPGFPSATVAGHAGQLVMGYLRGNPVVLLAGRLHLYEGHDPSLAAYPVRVMHAMGVRTLVLSNAAGGINRNFAPGDLMLIADHINLMFKNPLHGPEQPGDSRFPDMSEPYDSVLRSLMHECARELHIGLNDGVYAGMTGPSYETPAEVRMLGTFGADAVGMSTVPEVIVASALGIKTVAVSLISNKAAGLSNVALVHEEVLEAGRASASRFEGLVTRFVEVLGKRS